MLNKKITGLVTKGINNFYELHENIIKCKESIECIFTENHKEFINLIMEDKENFFQVAGYPCYNWLRKEDIFYFCDSKDFSKLKNYYLRYKLGLFKSQGGTGRPNIPEDYPGRILKEIEFNHDISLSKTRDELSEPEVRWLRLKIYESEENQLTIIKDVVEQIGPEETKKLFREPGYFNFKCDLHKFLEQLEEKYVGDEFKFFTFKFIELLERDARKRDLLKTKV